jgi:hypothetical protein
MIRNINIAVYSGSFRTLISHSGFLAYFFNFLFKQLNMYINHVLQNEGLRKNIPSQLTWKIFSTVHNADLELTKYAL